MDAGVPQGIVLGDLLYVLYTADIPTLRNNKSMIATFADVTVLLTADSNIRIATKRLQKLLDDCLCWFRKG